MCIDPQLFAGLIIKKRERKASFSKKKNEKKNEKERKNEGEKRREASTFRMLKNGELEMIKMI